MKWIRYCYSDDNWIPLNESFMDTIKSGWKKLKDVFKDRLETRLVGDDGQEEVGYVHDYDRKRGTCSLILKDKVDENVAAITGAIGGSSSSRDYGEPGKNNHVQ